MTFIATQLISKEDKRELEKVFLHFDKNKDGRLSKEEILNGYEEYYGTPPKMDEIDALFAKIDTDGSGTIDYSEFVVATLNQKTLLNDEKLRAAFKMFDRVSGYVYSGRKRKHLCQRAKRRARRGQGDRRESDRGDFERSGYKR